MSVPASFNIRARLSTIVRRLCWQRRVHPQIYIEAGKLRLPFKTLPHVVDPFIWEDGLYLHLLKELPLNALSGPVQEDKAQARTALVSFIDTDMTYVENFDLQQICGLVHKLSFKHSVKTFEELTATQQCRHIRIISYNDFLKTIQLSLPGFRHQQPLELRQACWLGDRYYWDGDLHPEALAHSIVYARRRGLKIRLPARITRYCINKSGLAALEKNYHTPIMPVEAWTDPVFMGLLVETHLPYARLVLKEAPGQPEILMLPKNNAQANELGLGLYQAGAQDLVNYLRAICQSDQQSA